jgi:hypothetical protein
LQMLISSKPSSIEAKAGTDFITFMNGGL